MKQHLYFLLAGGSLLAGCGKDPETQPVLAGSYQAGPVISTADIMLYTSTGRVDNRAMVDNFLARRKNLSGYFSRVDVALPTAYSLTLAFRGNNRVTLLSKSATSTDSTLTEITAQSAQRLVLANKDSISNLRPGSPSRVDQLSDLIPGEQPVRRCAAASVSSGTYALACRYRPIRVITSHDGKLFLPQLSWLIQTGNGYGISYWAYSGVQNTFNTAVLSQLQAGDTLVVQAREIAFSKK